MGSAKEDMDTRLIAHQCVTLGELSKRRLETGELIEKAKKRLDKMALR